MVGPIILRAAAGLVPVGILFATLPVGAGGGRLVLGSFGGDFPGAFWLAAPRCGTGQASR